MMDSDLRELYQETILDHSKNPHNKGELKPCTHEASWDNQTCGDHVAVTMNVSDDARIEDIRFEGEGCAISVASGSIMTEILKGMCVGAALEVFEYFQALCTQDEVERAKVGDKGLSEEDLAQMDILARVKQFPARVSCAAVAWNAMREALNTNPGEHKHGSCSCKLRND